ncbi:DUF167 family protein [Kaarinaea lacus]
MTATGADNTASVAPWCRWQGADLLLQILVQPKSSKDQIVGTYDDPLKGGQLKIKITAAPVDGKANQHLIKFLAKSFKVSKADIDIVSGETSRSKRVLIRDPKHLPEIFALSTISLPQR